MFKYNIYLGYQRSMGGFPILGTIEYPYHLQKGDVIIVANEIFNAIDSVAKDVSKESLRYNQQYRVASIHHTIDFKSQTPDIYLVTESDYKNKYSEQIDSVKEIETILEKSNVESRMQLIKEVENVFKEGTKEKEESVYRKIMNNINQAIEDQESIMKVVPLFKGAWGGVKKLIGLDD